MHYAGLQEPGALSAVQKIAAIPMKRFERPMIGYLHRDEIAAIIKTPNTNTWSGRRDRTLFATLYNTGARVSEIVNVKCVDIENTQCSALHLHGKGRKQRVVPLWKRTSRALRQWLPQIDQQPQNPLFPNRFGKPMTRSGVGKQLRSAVAIARKQCPSLEGKKVSPHTIRHTTAMHLLQSGVDISVIAMWLGHESIVTTHHYMQADLEMKKQALQKVKAPKVGAVTFKPSQDVLAFLESL
jgi:site-specific recombinase XerD